MMCRKQDMPFLSALQSVLFNQQRLSASRGSGNDNAHQKGVAGGRNRTGQEFIVLQADRGIGKVIGGLF